jgi:glycosyltransferase involved in cell wall biosynthesis
MRIGITTSVMGAGKTGIGQYLLSLLRQYETLAPSTMEFFLFCLEGDLPMLSSYRRSMTLVPVPEDFRPAARDILWHQWEFPRWIDHFSLDVVHVPSYRRLLWSGKRAARVATIHDLAPFKIPGKYDWKRMLYAKTVCPLLARRQDALIAISTKTADDMEVFFGLDQKEIHVIPNGIDHSRFRPAEREEESSDKHLRSVLNLPQGPFMLFVSRIEHPGKNHHRLIKAFERFKARRANPWSLVLAGEDAKGAGEVHRLIDQSNVAMNIHRLGFVKDEWLPSLYRLASLMVYPSLYEGFGLPPVEAMACGCPVLCSACGALGDVVGRAAALTDPENVETMSLDMERLCFNEAARDNLRQLGFARARDFDWRESARKTLQVYTQVA